MKRLLILTMIVSALSVTGFLWGERICLSMWPGSLRPTQDLYKDLALTPVQKGALKNLEGTFGPKGRDLCMRICAERLDLLKLLDDKSADSNRVLNKVEQIGEMQLLLEKEIALHILEVKKVLSESQSGLYMNRLSSGLQCPVAKIKSAAVSE